jgi:hypothetical protein
VAPTSLRSFLDQSLAILAREAPGSYRRLCDTFAGRRLRVTGDEEEFGLDFRDRSVVIAAARGDEAIVAGIDRRTIVDMVDAHLTIEEALRLDRLTMRASLKDALTAFDGMEIYLRGAIRCPSFPGLLAQLRASLNEEERRVNELHHHSNPE